MPTHSAASPNRNVARAAALGLWLALVGAVVPDIAVAQQQVRPDDEVELTLDQARNLAVHALRTDQPGLAIQLARGLLSADPRDPLAHYVIASAYAQLDKPREGRRAAARAYRYSDTGPDQFQAAQLAARLAYIEGNPTLAQVWLRRTAIHAPTEDVEELLAQDYKILRVANPWAFRLRTDVRPSNNVNNGADTSLQIIDGVPVTGVLSPTARALSGLIGVVDVAASYRLRLNQNSATSVAGRLYVQRVALSSDSRQKAPNAHNSDFASTYAEVSLRHVFAVGAADSGETAAANVAFGESWYAQDRSYRFGRISGERNWRMDDGRTLLTLHALAEQRYKARFGANDARILGLGAEMARVLNNGDKVSVSLAYRDTNAKIVNGTFKSASLRTDYTFGRPVGPAQIRAGVVFGYSDYPQYITFISAPGGRQDQSVYGDLSLFFHQYDYAGFAPMLRFRTGKKSSNISRFDTRELSVSLSVESKF